MRYDLYFKIKVKNFKVLFKLKTLKFQNTSVIDSTYFYKMICVLQTAISNTKGSTVE